MPKDEKTDNKNKRKKTVSILDVAAEVGVSKTTVGYVLSGQAKERRVSDKTAQKVLQAAKKLNYVPHLWAKNLARKSTKVVGLILSGYEYNWATEIMNGVIPVLEKDHFIPLTSVHLWDSNRCDAEIETSLQRRDDGLICQPLPGCVESYKRLEDGGVPFLFISDTLEQFPQASFVAWDSLPAAEIAVKHLIETGRKRIGFIGSSLVDLKFTRGRYEKYREVMDQAGLQVDENWVFWSNLSEFVRRKDIHREIKENPESIIQHILEDIFANSSSRPDAFFFPHDSLALQVYKVLLKMDISVPDDIALVGMGDVPLSDEFGVGLTTVREPLEEIGKAAAESILELIKNSSAEPIQLLVKGNDLRIRHTTQG